MTPRSRILLVDDEVAIQRSVGPLLRSRGYEVEIAGTGATPLLVAVDGHLKGNLEFQLSRADESRQYLRIEVHPLLMRDVPAPHKSRNASRYPCGHTGSRRAASLARTSAEW